MKTKDIIAAIFGFIFLAVLMAFIVYLFKLVISNIASVNPNVIAALIAGSITVTGYFITRYLERKKAIEFQIREQKLPIYEEFMSFFFEVLFDEKYKSLTEEEKNARILGFMRGFSQKSIIWLSDNTLKEYIVWKKLASSLPINANKEQNILQLQSFERLLFAFRKDIGHSNKDINQGDLLSMFITDWHELIRQNK